ncbi:SpoIIE family protein phosphatase [Roseobacter sp. N2S]|uniref:PP2C family protein-serine/threonine phosphatase n=1 Tax=Roseobacter sp. N2S TaxID=2663844 RepID=UPI0028562ECD|nr:SpoIIE family protein phosphatase [Roseobacter sp. N2S]MDR6263424.1 sigma-B regulation protein RsbU (phosphoserine phosphatase) [Roseobacter sp. N2S]
MDIAVKYEESSQVLTQTQLATQLRVLVVDDSTLQRRIVSLNLKKWGFDVTEAASGLEALEICKKQDIDLVLSDWMMPEMDGLEFCKEFRKLDRSRYGYFILLTSKNEKNDVAQGLDIGADDFLSKPVNSAELKARIRAGTRVLDMEKTLIDQNETLANALEELQGLYEGINKDLVEAEKLQQSLIPIRHKQISSGDLSVLFQSSSHVGGDLVGFFNFSETRLGLYSIDVSGHGVSSALLTARLAGYLSSHNKEQNVAFERLTSGQYRQRTPSEIAATLNQLMMEELDTEHYFTLAFADVNLTTGQVEMVQAGHPHPVVFNPSSGVTFYGSGGPPIGLMPDLEFETFMLKIIPGDRLLLYSDGLTECQNFEDDLLDDEGLTRILDKHSNGSGPEFMADLIWELTEFANGRPFEDDVSAIMFEFTGYAVQSPHPSQ